MAQIPQNGLFEPVLPPYNAGSRGSLAGKTGRIGHLAHQIEQAEFTQSWIVGCIARVPATSGRFGKDLLVKLTCLLTEFATDESGATAIEYGLIAAGIALAIIEVIYALGTDLVAKLQSLANALK